MGERLKRRGGFLVALLAVCGLMAAVPTGAPGSVLVAKYEAANFRVTGGRLDDFLRKTGNNPNVTSEGALMVLFGAGDLPQAARMTATTPADADHVVVAVRGQPCLDPADPGAGPWPHFTVRIDGRQAASTYATSTRWRSVGIPIDLPAGLHSIAITFDNDFERPGICDRNLRIDHVALFSSGPPAPRTTWAPVGAQPLSDQEAAMLVSPAPENRPDNAAANSYVPSDAELAAFRSARDNLGRTPVEYNPLATFVTGRPGLSDPSTDELIQWAAQKWGIPEDVIRAQVTTESSWRQSMLGDRRAVSSEWYLQYPPQARVPGTSDVYQSMGITQVKWIPDGSVHNGTEPLRWKSTAFNLDYYAATLRYYYNGLCTWCSGGYAPGQEWLSVGGWFNPQPWENAGQLAYIARVQANLASRPWESPGF
jgi:hypothetical protein